MTLLTFITALYALAEHCNYGTLHNEMVRDRIVVVIRDSSLSEKLKFDVLTLTTAIAKICQAEEVKKQQPLLRGETPAAGRDLISLWGRSREEGAVED